MAFEENDIDILQNDYPVTMPSPYFKLNRPLAGIFSYGEDTKVSPSHVRYVNVTISSFNQGTKQLAYQSNGQGPTPYDPGQFIVYSGNRKMDTCSRSENQHSEQSLSDQSPIVTVWVKADNTINNKTALFVSTRDQAGYTFWKYDGPNKSVGLAHVDAPLPDNGYAFNVIDHIDREYWTISVPRQRPRLPPTHVLFKYDDDLQGKLETYTGRNIPTDSRGCPYNRFGFTMIDDTLRSHL